VIGEPWEPKKPMDALDEDLRDLREPRGAFHYDLGRFVGSDCHNLSLRVVGEVWLR
jgi:hypothetical protein